MGGTFDSAPIWCWNSCDGKRHSPPTVGTAALLMGDYGYYRDSTVLVELKVPEVYCLLSSYTVWNDAVIDLFEHKRTTIVDEDYLYMFEEPLIRHAADDIQAVLPYILSDWIVDVRELPETDDWDVVL